eukprot:scaffold19457_cov140-Isochrysis_galbana.AAC.4
MLFKKTDREKSHTRHKQDARSCAREGSRGPKEVGEEAASVASVAVKRTRHLRMRLSGTPIRRASLRAASWRRRASVRDRPASYSTARRQAEAAGAAATPQGAVGAGGHTNQRVLDGRTGWLVPGHCDQEQEAERDKSLGGAGAV